MPGPKKGKKAPPGRDAGLTGGCDCPAGALPARAGCGRVPPGPESSISGAALPGLGPNRGQAVAAVKDAGLIWCCEQRRPSAAFPQRASQRVLKGPTQPEEGRVRRVQPGRAPSDTAQGQSKQRCAIDDDIVRPAGRKPIQVEPPKSKGALLESRRNMPLSAREAARLGVRTASRVVADKGSMARAIEPPKSVTDLAIEQANKTGTFAFLNGLTSACATFWAPSPPRPQLVGACAAKLGGSHGIYQAPRTHNVGFESPWEWLICDIMSGAVSIPMTPPANQRFFANIRTLDWVKRSGEDNSDLEVVDLPGWIDCYKGIRIVTLFRDTPWATGGPVPMIPGGSPPMPVRMEQAVLNAKLLYELALRTIAAGRNISVTFGPHCSSVRWIGTSCDIGGACSNEFACMPGRDETDPGFPGIRIAGLLEPPWNLSLEIRRMNWVDSSGTLLMDQRGSNTQISDFNNAALAQPRGEHGWTTNSDAWDASGANPDNRVFLKLGGTHYDRVVPYSWYEQTLSDLASGVAPTPPSWTDLTRERTLPPAPQPSSWGPGTFSPTATTVRQVRATRRYWTLMHELAHLGLKHVGLQYGHGTHCGWPNFATSLPNPIPLTFQGGNNVDYVTGWDVQNNPIQVGDDVVPKMAAHARVTADYYAVHAFCDYFATQLTESAFGLDGMDDRSYTYQKHLEACWECGVLGDDGKEPAYYGNPDDFCPGYVAPEWPEHPDSWDWWC